MDFNGRSGAMGVLLGAPLMSLTTGKIPRRYLLVGLMAIFTLGNLMSALATDYYSLMIARVVTSLNHGAFFGVGSIVAASVVAPDKRAGAVAAMFMGLTLATIGGVPLAAWFGEMFGWRTAFWGITGLGVVANTPNQDGDGSRQRPTHQYCKRQQDENQHAQRNDQGAIYRAVGGLATPHVAQRQSHTKQHQHGSDVGGKTWSSSSSPARASAAFCAA